MIEAGATGHIKVRNPWPGESVTAEERVLRGEELDIAVENGKSYALQPAQSSKEPVAFAPVSGVLATQPKSLGTRRIGMP